MNHCCDTLYLRSAPGESRIPTVRRSGLPRPTSAASSQLQLGPLHYNPGPAPLTLSQTSPSYEDSREIIANPAHLQGNSLHHPQAAAPRLRIASAKVGRLSESELPEPAQNRRAQRPGSNTSRLNFQYGSSDIWPEEKLPWSRESHESGLRGLKASTESAFSRQLAKITRGSNEDVSDPCLIYRVTSIRGPRSCWDGPLHSVSATEPPSTHLSRESVGRRVVVGGAEHGTLRYYGRTAFSPGEWCGVELERQVGKNDGSVDGVIYFSCRPGFGIFAPAGKVFLDLDYIGDDDGLSLSTRNTSQSSVWQGLMPSSIHSQEANPTRRRPSDASNATYTIEGRDSSLPTSPESQDSLQPREFTQTKRTTGHDDHEDDVASLGSPEDATCDESSLGILTPDQMPDFTVTASASFGRSPSDEDVAALEDEVCDASLPAEASGRGEASSMVPLLRWDSDPSVTGVDEELFKNDVSAIIRELRTSAEVSSSGGSSPSRPHPSPETEQFQHDEEELEQQQKQEDEEDKKASLKTCKELQREVLNQIVEEQECQTIPELREVSVNVDLSRLSSMARRVAPLTARLLLASAVPEMTPDTEAAWSGAAAAAMTTSAGSLDQGYQGDAECDPRSEGGTGTASSPTEDVRLFQGVIDVERLTEADVSLADDEGEADHHGNVTARDRTARIIDGKLYHSHRELGRAHDNNTSEMDSSGFYSDLDPRDRDAEDESARTDLEPVQEALGNSNLHDSLLDDQSHTNDDSTRYDHTFDDHSLKDDLIEEKEGSYTIDEEDRSSASTLRPESKDLTLSEQQDHTQSSTDTKQNSPSPANNSSSSCDSRVSSVTKNKDGTSAPTIDPKLTDSGISVEGGEDGVKAQQSLKPRTYDKPWLSRPPPPKKKEEIRKQLPPPPPMPKKNVQSKLKALLEAQEHTNEECRRPRQPRKNRWDEVMNKIAEGQKEDKVRPKVKEVKSRLMEGVMIQTQLSPQAERIRQERRERRERRERQAANAAVAARRASQARGDRKRSSASIRSNRTSRAPSLDSLPTDPVRVYSRGSTPEHSEASHKSSEYQLTFVVVAGSVYV
ncbi:CAP-Gly domain-containing linker protein 1-like 2 [Homarus americanus]|uniref:CAP-Gly domain-containing linker protein 1-like 2 n=1 Tax=Homarus americanus TaxID=6706 RepID=A0A8J5TKE9_HOMAM|nr:CAP-Gly domain-containing linker protein 1-like 2 [Homarus americanus]